jgi:hypothetical protein
VSASSNLLAALALSGLALVSLGRWWWQPRAAAAEARTAEVDAMLERIATELDAEPRDDARLRTLRWDTSGDCTQVYAFTIDESHANESVALFLGQPEEHSRWLLGIGPHPMHEDRLAAMLVPDPEPPGDDEPTRLRELFIAPDARELGPAAPDFACRSRRWDPLEDALALGWPKLPANPVRAGDRWIGQVVGGRCHETPCLDATGQFDRARSCQARPWQEQLVGWLEPEIAVIRSSWDDGQQAESAARRRMAESAEPTNSLDFGILTWRELAMAEGRPVLARAEIWHRWTGVVRTLELRALEQCAPGGPLEETIERVRASLRAPG